MSGPDGGAEESRERSVQTDGAGESRDRPAWTGDATVDAVFDALVATAPEIRAQLAERRTYVDRENPSGERVSEADDFADERLRERLLPVDGVASYASEEREQVLTAAAVDAVSAPEDGGYHLAVDPLDGSSNLRSNNPMGTILGVYDEPFPAQGRSLVAAAMVLYGPNTTMVATAGDGVREYLVDADGAELLTDGLELPDDPSVYGVGGRRPDWTDPVESAVESLEDDRLSLRYGGALVADVNQVLTRGGLFAYPELADRPAGKLRYQFECAPVGFIVEAAGGSVSDGEGDLLAAEPDALHDRTPFYVGDVDLVRQFERSIADRE